MPVYQIRYEMPFDELMGWQEYFQIREEERKRAEKKARQGK